MAHQCMNFLWADFQSENGKKLYAAFTEAAPKETSTHQTQIEGTGLFLSAIYCDQDQINFETKWGTPREQVEEIAKLFQVDFELDSEESGSEVYERYFYENGQLHYVSLDQKDRARIIDYDWLDRNTFFWVKDEAEFEQIKYGKEDFTILFATSVVENDKIIGWETEIEFRRSPGNREKQFFRLGEYREGVITFDGEEIDSEGGAMWDMLDEKEKKYREEMATCPSCNRNNTRPDLDFPMTMRCCDDCGCDYMLEDHEIVLDPKTL